MDGLRSADTWGMATMHLVERLSERLARQVSRRRTLKGAASVLFANVAAAAAHGRGVDAARCAVRLVDDTQCNLPFLTSCADTDSTFCDGSSCSDPCRSDPRFYAQDRQTACWCTALTPVGTSRKKRQYWTCCDCICSQEIAPSPGSPWVSTAFSDGGWGCGCRKQVTVTFDPPGGHRKGSGTGRRG